VNQLKTHTACDVEQDLSDILHVRQLLQRVQTFLDDDPQGPSFVLVFPVDDLGPIEQTCHLLVR
jgi:hypothetical protein